MGGGPSSHALSHRGQDVDSTDFLGKTQNLLNNCVCFSSEKRTHIL